MICSKVYRQLILWKNCVIVFTLPIVLLPLPVVGQTSVSTVYSLLHKQKKEAKITFKNMTINISYIKITVLVMIEAPWSRRQALDYGSGGEVAGSNSVRGCIFQFLHTVQILVRSLGRSH